MLLLVVQLETFRNRSSLWKKIILEVGLSENLRNRRLRERLRLRRKLNTFDVHFLVSIHTSSRRNEVADDDVLLESKQLVASAANCSVGQNTRGLLERCSRDERLRRERCLGDSEKQRLRSSRCLLLLLRLLVCITEVLLVDVLALEERSLTGLENANLLQHLPNNDTDVLVIDLHTLQAV